MNDFSGYEKMPDSLKKLGLNEKDLSRMDKLNWVVTEKIHGANFSFSYENNSLRYAKRREYLNWKDDFFGFQLVANRLETKVIRLFEHLSSIISGTRYIIYGELFGGKYPHSDIEAVENIQAIQTGVYYTPDIHFYAFDIAVVEELGVKNYLDYETVALFFEQFEIPYVKPLFIGKFNEAINFNIRINSPIPKQMGLPELEHNLIEGVVVKPFNLKDVDLLSYRPIIKLKNPEFDEEEKFHKAEKWSFVPDIFSKTENLSFITDELRTYVSNNRLESVLSKVGALDINNPLRVSEIQSEFLQDVLTDFNEDNNNLLDELTHEDKEWIIERIQSEIKNRLVAKG
ncbi:RNA ligase family protein [Chryseobacterium sp. PMSZPI]|uniref:RNA ligase family protein n=1 Tax=Chryseobacterium sp. PMSZPI TaxID=1033900 RepID=UPI000C3402B1|nr:RNA ligase family protein [Chryseobacterium sp. PMSZPI]PKF76009.1 2'-5' RNA ligase [Chryseobacterium sp. PMSZPI]